LKGPHWIARAMDYMTKPFEWVSKKLPEEVQQAVAKKTNDFVLGPLASDANKTFADKHVLADFDPAASSIEDVRSRATDSMWAAAEKQWAVNAVFTVLQGFGCGLGGVALAAVDIPAVFLANFRSANQVAYCFGYQYDALQLEIGRAH